MTWFDIIKYPQEPEGGVGGYMVKDEIWQEGKGEDMMTMADLEKNLGRTLVLDDFTNAPINWAQYSEKPAIKNRIGMRGIKHLMGQYMNKSGTTRDWEYGGPSKDNLRQAALSLGFMFGPKWNEGNVLQI